ncbi:hypothetical protein HMPREF1551_02583 [Capnocytophaga sp. oral taxon 863 str. F0517]|uniref:NfeD family protein n=1 Tax=Capnocytophaga sp. oral taxon 863 TaxID=1227265 RepID=UPI000397953C|nr:NfeD family protein [Capnocytophaga sp. oral taxon 863]ERI61572.1 hypothetical protein HMPREF1551_02583 [Capnocytophaga sp. oral taxon 863 str. F0517]
MEFFSSMEPYLQGFWFIAVPVSIIFVIQTVMTFVGANASDGLAADFDGDFSGHDAPFQLFSLRNLVNFLLGFSWTGISFYELISNKIALIIFAVLIGGLFVYIFFLTMQALMKLAEDNSFKIEETLGKTAQVYIPIPEHLSGRGKVTLSIRGSFHELEAVTEGDRIPTNATVRVVKVQDQLLYVVRG